MDKFVVITLAAHRYALRVSEVREVLRWQPVTPLPKTPPFIEGVINVRNRLIGVVDLRARLDLGKAKRDEATRILLIRLPKALVGFIVDGVQQVAAFSVDAVENTQAVLPVAFNHAFVAGLIRDGGEILILLDPAALFSPDEAVQLACVHRAAP